MPIISNKSILFNDSTGLPVSRHGLHAFPARMAPEIVVKAVSSIPRGSTVLDSMCGSGTVLRESVRLGHRAIGFDVDPLAILISRVSTRCLDFDLLLHKAEEVANQAASVNGDTLYLPWIDTNLETRNFIEFWFGSEQRRSLRSLSWLISSIHSPIGDALKLAVSKIIITKEPRASLARDTSHSRPHKVLLNSTYDVIRGFRNAVIDISRKLSEHEMIGTAKVTRSDARRLPFWVSNQAHLVVTSPPYGNAIDYLRGHRLALVWLGYDLPQIKKIKMNNIGRQTGISSKNCPYLPDLITKLGQIEGFHPATRSRLSLFVQDMYFVLKEIHRSLLPHGHAILVIGNSMIDGQLIDNANMISTASQYIGMKEIARNSRDIPSDHRYLPPPKIGCDSALSKRMREEIILTFEKL